MRLLLPASSVTEVQECSTAHLGHIVDVLTRSREYVRGLTVVCEGEGEGGGTCVISGQNVPFHLQSATTLLEATFAPHMTRSSNMMPRSTFSEPSGLNKRQQRFNAA